MAVEAQRGCGYRKVGGTYMVSSKFHRECDRLPFRLEVCPCCGEGYRPSRTLRQITPEKILQGQHSPCECEPGCFICNPSIISAEELDWNRKNVEIGHYLEWVGTGFYGTPEEFVKEAAKLGISRRLKSGVPRRLVVGKSIIFLAHKRATFVYNRKSKDGRRREIVTPMPAIFMAFTVFNLEHICTDIEYQDVQQYQAMQPDDRDNIKWAKRTMSLVRMLKNGVTLIQVPHNDLDHR